MKYRALAAFSAGALFATVIVGATQLVGASNDNVITVCANKRTGAMQCQNCFLLFILASICIPKQKILIGEDTFI